MFVNASKRRAINLCLVLVLAFSLAFLPASTPAQASRLVQAAGTVDPGTQAQTLNAGNSDASPSDAASGRYSVALSPAPMLTINPTSGPPGTVVSFSGVGFSPGGMVTVALVRGLGIVVAELTADAGGEISGSFVMPTPQDGGEFGFGPIDVFAIDEATGEETPPATFILTRPPAPVTSVFFAEGATIPPFDTWFLVQNPGPNPATLTFTFQLLGGGTVVRTFETGPTSRFSLFANQVLPNQAFSTRIDSNQPIFAERSMFVSFDGHVVTQIPSPAQLWLFAEGATVQPFHTWLLIQNPNDAPVMANVTIFGVDGEVSTITQTVAPLSRLGVFLNLFTNLASFAIRVDASAPVIAERAMYFGAEPRGAHATVGAPELSTVWNFGEGSTAPPFTEVISVLNPSDQQVGVTMEFFLQGGGTVVRQFTVGPARKLSVAVNDIVPNAANSGRVSTTLPTVVERTMFLVKDGNLGGHATVGIR